MVFNRPRTSIDGALSVPLLVIKCTNYAGKPSLSVLIPETRWPHYEVYILTKYFLLFNFDFSTWTATTAINKSSYIIPIWFYKLHFYHMHHLKLNKLITRIKSYRWEFWWAFDTRYSFVLGDIALGYVCKIRPDD